MRPVNKYCLLRDDEDLKIAIRAKMKVGFHEIARELQLDRMNIKNYLNGKNNKALTQFDVLRLAKHVGIEVTLKLTIFK